MTSRTQDADKPKGLFGRRRKKKDPNKPGWFAQIRQVLSMTHKADPSAIWWMIGAAVAVELVMVLIGLWWGPVLYMALLGIPLALLAAVVILGRKAERAAFTQIEGQAGATSAVIGQLRRGWYYDKEPVAAEAGRNVRGVRDLANAAMVFRAVGKQGVVLLAEGPKSSAQRLMDGERRKISRVVGEDVPVHTMLVGQGDGRTPMRSVVKTMKGYPKKISDAEAMVVHQRMKSLAGKSKASVPAGMDPSKPPRAGRGAMRRR